MCMRDSSGAMAVMSAATARRRVGNVRAGAHASGGRASLVGLLCLFQAEDGIRDLTVTGVQTCALPISRGILKTDLATLASGRRIRIYGNLPYYITSPILHHLFSFAAIIDEMHFVIQKIGRASCRERV